MEETQILKSLRETELFIMNTEILNDDLIFNYYLNNSSEFRKAKVNAFVFRKDKNLSLGAGIIIDKYLSKMGLREKDREYFIGPFGKPSFVDIPNIDFSISHSGLYACVAFSGSPVGCDIEKITDIDKKLINLCLESSETADEKSFFDSWTKKESYLKAKGLGLSKEMSSFSASDIEKEFKVYQEETIPGYSLCVCYGKNSSPIKIFHC